jgi:O-acetyl-ADP-ribose deacetylase (regulator of RNase III)
MTLRTALGGEFAVGEHWDFEAILKAAAIVSAARKFCEHDGGPGSKDYNARETFDARHAMKSALGEHMEMRSNGGV